MIERRLTIGLLLAFGLTLPLWVAVFGWVKLLYGISAALQ